jgi:hypothetical protein
VFVATGRQEGGGYTVGEFGVCYGEPEFLTATGEPLLVARPILQRGGSSAVAVGFAAAPAAKKVELRNSDGTRRIIDLRRLNRFQARKTRMERFSYAAFVLRGRWCIDQLITLNSEGKPLWESAAQRCSAEDQARGNPAAALRQLLPLGKHSFRARAGT